MLLDRLRIASKLVLLAAIPLLALAALALPIVVMRASAANEAAKTSRAVQATDEVGGLIRALQRERLLAVGYLAGQVSQTDLLFQQAASADQSQGVRQSLGGDLTPSIEKGLDQERSLAALRAGTLAKTVSLDKVAVGFQSAIQTLIDSLGLVYRADSTTSVGRQVLALDTVLRADEVNARTSVTVLQVLVNPSGVLASRLAAQLGLFDEYDARFDVLATPDQVEIFDLIREATNARAGLGFIGDNRQIDTYESLDGQTVVTTYPRLLSLTGQGGFVESKLTSDIMATTSDQQRSALIYAYAIGGASILVVVLVVLLTVLVARSVAQPLIRLTASAKQVAIAAEAELTRISDDESEAFEQLRLDEVDMTGRDEVGDLARAFDRIQTTAARLVERQAASRRNVATMFGHIGRRTQNLVARQLAMIDRLEQQETNSDRLRNLYQLDHLSSRLSRNAGSLVVISGSTAHDEQGEPLPVADVVRLALGEIEDYTRVELDIPESLIVRPSVVGDLTLVFAELMENATAYSPPHTKVRVTAEETRAGAQILVIDNGIGMAPERLAEENARLTRRERLDLVPTEVLGLFVTGRLARRHSFGVTLVPTLGGGVTAVIALTDRQLLGPVGQSIAALPAGPLAQPSPGTQVAVAGGKSFAPLALSSPAFDQVALERATRAISAGPSWDAFAASNGLASAASAAPVAASAAPVAAITSGQPTSTNQVNAVNGAWSTPTEPPAACAPTVGGAQVAASGQEATPRSWWEPSSPARVAIPPAPPSTRALPEVHQPAGLQRRVPGAQFPLGAAGRRIEPPAVAADPAAARALIEEFEAGVRSAERQRDPGRVPQLPAPPPLPSRVAPAAAARPTSPSVGPAAAAMPPAGTPSGMPAPARGGGLTRRIPGATLGVLQAPVRSTPAAVPAPGDADAARALIEQIESGVSRALNEVVDDHRHEGLPR